MREGFYSRLAAVGDVPKSSIKIGAGYIGFYGPAVTVDSLAFDFEPSRTTGNFAYVADNYDLGWKAEEPDGSVYIMSKWTTPVGGLIDTYPWAQGYGGGGGTTLDQAWNTLGARRLEIAAIADVIIRSAVLSKVIDLPWGIPGAVAFFDGVDCYVMSKAKFLASASFAGMYAKGLTVSTVLNAMALSFYARSSTALEPVMVGQKKWDTTPVMPAAIKLSLESLYNIPNFIGLTPHGRLVDEVVAMVPRGFHCAWHPAQPNDLFVGLRGTYAADGLRALLGQDGHVLSTDENSMLNGLRKSGGLACRLSTVSRNGPANAWKTHDLTKDYADDSEFLNSNVGDSGYTAAQMKSRISGMASTAFGGTMTASNPSSVSWSYSVTAHEMIYTIDGGTVSFEDVLAEVKTGGVISTAVTTAGMDTDTSLTSGLRTRYLGQITELYQAAGTVELSHYAPWFAGCPDFGIAPTGNTWISAHSTPDCSALTKAAVGVVMQLATPMSKAEATSLGRKTDYAYSQHA